MKTALSLYVRAFPVRVYDCLADAEREELIVLDKSQLQAAQVVGQSSNEIIRRLCERQGLTVLDIGKAVKREISLNLGEVYKLHTSAMRGVQ